MNLIVVLKINLNWKLILNKHMIYVLYYWLWEYRNRNSMMFFFYQETYHIFVFCFRFHNLKLTSYLNAFQIASLTLLFYVELFFISSYIQYVITSILSFPLFFFSSFSRCLWFLCFWRNIFIFPMSKWVNKFKKQQK